MKLLDRVLNPIESHRGHYHKERLLAQYVMNSKLKLLGFLGVLLLTGCASEADENSEVRITTAADYKLFDCQQLTQHARDVSAQAAALAGLKN
jgi:hypothetical protein